MHLSLRDLQRALKGFVVLSAELEAMGNACFDQRYVSTSVFRSTVHFLVPIASRKCPGHVDRGSVPVHEAAGSVVQGPAAAPALHQLLDRHGHPAGLLGLGILLPTGTLT